MKYSIFFAILVFGNLLFAQQKVNPVIPSFGGIYAVDNATVVPDAELDYNIIVDIKTGSSLPENVSPALNNVARMINLLKVGGADASKINVVLAVHASATYALLNDQAYQEKYDILNPNAPLIKELATSGVKIAVCGQSMIGRRVNEKDLLDEVEVATSMLTTVATYQLKGYAFFQF